MSQTDSIIDSIVTNVAVLFFIQKLSFDDFI